MYFLKSWDKINNINILVVTITKLHNFVFIGLKDGI